MSGHEHSDHNLTLCTRACIFLNLSSCFCNSATTLYTQRSHSLGMNGLTTFRGKIPLFWTWTDLFIFFRNNAVYTHVTYMILKQSKDGFNHEEGGLLVMCKHSCGVFPESTPLWHWEIPWCSSFFTQKPLCWTSHLLPYLKWVDCPLGSLCPSK